MCAMLVLGIVLFLFLTNYSDSFRLVQLPTWLPNNSLNLSARYARARFVAAAQQVFGLVLKLIAV
jgi:hypothetical protein